MSSLLSGDIKLALEDLEKNDNNLSKKILNQPAFKIYKIY